MKMQSIFPGGPMNSLSTIAFAAVAVFLAAPAAAQQKPARSLDQLGTVSFANSCAPAVQDKLQQGVAMLHSFWYSETEKTMREVLAADPSCAVANWGIAAILMQNPLAGQGSTAEGAKRASAAIEQGRATGARTPRERDYIEAVAAYYEDFGNRKERTRQEARAKAFEELAARYPGDDEAQIFSALYGAALQSQADQTYQHWKQSAAILEKQFAKYPGHPGIAHYLIHSYDAPPMAEKGLSAARRYADIAPAAPHALHMPSHIFTRVGSWSESVATNRRSAAAALAGGEPNEALHASDYMVYAYLQLARDAEALKTVTEMLAFAKANPSRAPGAAYALAAMPARYAIERGDWKTAAQLEPGQSSYLYTPAMTHYARALGSARSGNPAAAQQDLAEIGILRDALVKANDKYWATEVEVNWLGAAAWIALAQGRQDEALTLMTRSADLEDKSDKHIVTPGRILPARELLGEMLLQVNRPREALAAFEASQLREPGRFRGLYGAAEAAAKSGDTAKARQYYARLVEMAGKGDPRPELARARAAM
jgi:tetratricopeptide (TPR) repeat protein